MRSLLLVLHIILVCVWLGANVVQGFIGPSVASAESSIREWWATAQSSMALLLYNVAGVGILVTGLLLMFAVDSPYGFSDPFISIGFLAVIVGAALGMAVFGPGYRGLAAAIRSGDEARENSLVQKLTLFGVVDTLVVVLTIIAMVSKLGH